MTTATNKVKPSKIKYSTAQPTALIVNGLDRFGYEMAKSLTAQGGVVIIVDDLDRELDFAGFSELKDVFFLDFTAIKDLIEDIRRLDYVFFLNHNKWEYNSELSSQEFLVISNYLSQILNLTVEFEALFLLTNSIRAHKLYLASNTLESPVLKDGNRYISYTEAEFVRYSENLVVEYKQAKKIEAKVLRIGEILGEGVELSKDTNIGKLIWQTVQGSDLYLDGDGLESEHYVHLIDAVYGVVKAQFSSNLSSDIYTLAYPEPVTQLSLAYRIQEIEPEVGEIKFLDQEEKLEMKLPIYKAAPNLTEISWQPKVSFDKALAQSIAYTKKLLKIYQDEVAGESLENSDKELDTEKIKNTALAKLIADRKKQVSKDKKKFDQSLRELELKKQKSSIWKRIRRKFLRVWDKFKSNIIFLKDMTMFEASMYIVLLTIFLFVFFTIIAPIIGFARDSVLLEQRLARIETATENYDWEQVKLEAGLMKQNVDSLTKTVEGADILFSLIDQTVPRQEILGAFQAFDFMADSLENLAVSLESAEKYHEANSVELVFRPTNSSVLSVNDQGGQNQEVSLLEASTASDLAARSLDNAERIYDQLNTGVLPEFISSSLDKTYARAQDYSHYVDLAARTSLYLKQIDKNDYNVGVVLQDHIRSTYSGGKVVGLGVLEYGEGKLESVQLMQIDKVDLKSPNLTESAELEITKLALGDGYENAEAVPLLEKFDYLTDDEKFKAFSKSVLEETFVRDIDGLYILNTNSFLTLLDRYGEVQVNEQNVSASNYLQVTNMLQKDSLKSRNNIITNISAIALKNLLTGDNEQLLEKIDLLGQVYDLGGVNFSDELEDVFVTFEQTPRLEISLMKSDPTQFTVNPSVDLQIKSDLASGNSKTEIAIDSANTPDADRLLTCFTDDVGELDLGDVALENYSKFRLDDKICVRFSTTTKKDYEFSFERAYGENYSDSFKGKAGLEVRFDVEVSIPSAAELIDASPEPNRELNYLFYNGQVYNLYKFNLIFD